MGSYAMPTYGQELHVVFPFQRRRKENYALFYHIPGMYFLAQRSAIVSSIRKLSQHLHVLIIAVLRPLKSAVREFNSPRINILCQRANFAK